MIHEITDGYWFFCWDDKRAKVWIESDYTPKEGLWDIKYKIENIQEAFDVWLGDTSIEDHPHLTTLYAKIQEA